MRNSPSIRLWMLSEAGLISSAPATRSRTPSDTT
jgi:hypothetical protein